MLRISLAATVCACAAALVAPAEPGTVLRTSAFRLADGTAGCNLVGERLACRSVRVDAALLIARAGTPRAARVDVHWDPGTTVLRTGLRWNRAGISCRLAGDRIACTNATGSTIFAGPSGIGVAT